jgi:tuftelin-interacting protein 11
MITPWMAVFDAATVESLRLLIAGKLAIHLRNVVINPVNQQLGVLDNVLSWSCVLNQLYIHCLLCGEFFPNWHGILVDWLSRTDAEVNADIWGWYSGWKKYLKDRLRGYFDDRLRAELGFALDLIKRSREPSDKDLSWAPSFASFTQVLSDLREYSSQSGHVSSVSRNPTTEANHTSFKGFVAEFAQSIGVEFVLKSKRTHDGKSLFCFGSLTVYLDGNLAYVEESKGRWRAIGLDELASLSQIQNR